MNGFRAASTATLETIHTNLLQGLDLVADRIAAGTFHDVGAKGKAPPSESGQITLWMYQAVTEELARRTESATAMTTTTPAPTLADLFGSGCDCTGNPLTAAIDAGHVRTQDHPALPLRIYNYTEKAAYDRVWNDVTRQCRGLIVDTATQQVVARPLPKFWNHTEAESAGFALDDPAVVFDKADGSLAIIYPTPAGYAVATRGSFASEQAIHATTLLRARHGDWQPPAGLTVLAEIVYPSNRIVVDYGDLDDLILLGAVDIATGRTFGPDAVPDWPGLVVETFTYRSMAEALAAPVRDNREGFVVWFPESDRRLKIKYEAYVALHRIVTGLTARTVWEHLLSGEPLADLIAPLPDEFHPWVRGIAAGIDEAVNSEVDRLGVEYAKTVSLMPLGWNPADRPGRKDFAMIAATHPDKWALFALLDGRDIWPELLKRAKPEPYVTPSGRTFTEDNA